MLVTARDSWLFPLYSSHFTTRDSVTQLYTGRQGPKRDKCIRLDFARTSRAGRSLNHLHSNRLKLALHASHFAAT